MKNKTLSLFALTLLVMAFAVAGVNAASLSTWALTTDANAGSVNAKLSAGPLTVGTGLTGTLAFNTTNGTVGLTDWGSSTSIDANDYYQVTLTPSTGSNFVITSIKFDQKASTAGMKFAVNWSNNSFTSSTSITSLSGTSTAAFVTVQGNSLNLVVGEGETLTLRIYGYNAGTADNFNIKNLIIEGKAVPSEVVECSVNGDNGNLAIDVDDVSVEEGFGEDAEWFPLDTIKTGVDVDNDGNEKIKNILVNWGVFDESTGKWVMNEDESKFGLSDGDSKNVPITFDLEKVTKFKNDNYVFYTFVTGEDNEFDGAKTCVLDSQDVSIVHESDFVILDNLQYPNTAVQCGEEVTVTANAWNIGESDEDSVYILANNKDLGINSQKIELGDINSLENKQVVFTFNVPKDADEKTYSLEFSIYNEDNELFQNDFNDEEAVFKVFPAVKGNCYSVQPATVSAELESGGIAGEAAVINSTIKNSGSKSAQYVVTTDGYSSWASSSSVDAPTFSLAPGESKQVAIKLNVKEGVSGEQTFNIKVLSGNDLVTTQPVSVLVEAKSEGFLSSITGGAIGKGSSVWIIGALNVILILAIIIVAIRALRK